MSEPEKINLSSPRQVRELLERHGLKPQKKFGQNFLIDANILGQIVAAGKLQPADHVYEVGPGLGALTRALAEQLNNAGTNLTSVEKDVRLAPALKESLVAINASVVFADALEFDWHTAANDSVFVANLPYQISTAILTKLLECGRFKNLVVLVQREVALRLAAKPGQDNYGFLSAIVALSANVEKLRDVPASAFYPAPSVVSSVVRLTPNGQKLQPQVVQMLEIVLAHRRKTILNNLRLAGITDAATRLLAAGIEPTARAEDVPLQRIVGLAGL